MNIVSATFSLIFIAVTAMLLYRKYNPQGVLVFSGLLMIAAASLLGISPIEIGKPTGNAFFDLVKIINDTFLSNLARAGLMIMTIGGYVAFMNKIKATDALVYLAVKPLAGLKKHPYLAAILAIPIGQLLFITTPSAAGLGLLLVASFYPVLINLGVSKLTALSVISAATLFDQGPGSANTALAAELIGIGTIEYFLKYQLLLVLPSSAVIMLIYYFNNRYFDKKDMQAGKDIYAEPLDVKQKPNVPTAFAMLPLLPLVLLIVFSEYIGIFEGITLSTTVAMLISLIVSFFAILIHKRKLKECFELLKSFWTGMGNVFATVVTLIVAAEIFAKGLINIGFIESLIYFSTHLGLNAIGIAIIFTFILFLAAMLMGSGNASFFSFGPLVPDIAKRLGVQSYEMILPMQLSSSMGRAASPIAGVIVAIAGVAGVSPTELAKRNMIPLFCGLIFMTTYHFIIG